jgi:hypothetical protein
MIARVAEASKCREKCKKPEIPILVGDPKKTPPYYVPLYPLLHGKASSSDLPNAVHPPNS